MENYKRVCDLKKQALKGIEDAARNGDTATVVRLTSILQSTDRILITLENIETQVDGLKKLLETGEVNNIEIPITEGGQSLESSSENRITGGKLRGAQERTKFVREMKDRGTELIQEDGLVHCTQGGGFVGITYASPNKRDRNRWFLGLPCRHYAALVFLCENSEGEVLEFVLGQELFYKIRQHLSKSRDQYKFNIVLRGGRNYCLQVPGLRDLPINDCLGNYVMLTS